ATHPHVDHIQGMKEVLAECPAAVVLSGQHCFKSSDLPGASVIEVKGSNRLWLDEGTELWTWSPDIALDSATAISSAGNDISVLSRVKMGKISFLFTGDAGPAEFAMLDETNSEVASTVVKVPHHGSKYCWYDPFWDKQHSEYAVVSVGARNTFGHPNPMVLKRLGDSGIVVLRTDLDGAITFLTDGQEMQVQTMSSEISKNGVSTN
ncbi:MAG: ComEC/Rec2 family competence protein, partial [Ignavibacteriales bacterium]